MSVAGDLHPARVSALCGGRFGRTVVCFDSVGSTNTAAARLAEAGAPEGTVVIASDQTAGRGRGGRSWYSSEGGSLVFSVILRPSRSGETITALLALSALKVLDRLVDGAMLKWPNDIWVGHRKIAGILAESRARCVVVGMGLDVNDEEGSFPEELDGVAVSLRMLTGGALDRGEILSGILDTFSEDYGMWEREGFGPASLEMKRRMLWIGENVTLDSGAGMISGRLAGITSEGYLRLDTEEGEGVYSSGDLSLRKEGDR
jgi:BirA family biotin operon repressor/biotin-[acetyl-CoA-carboxylase] ligase